MFDYPYLEVLRAVEREASLERAAKSLDVTKSALSQTLATLDYRMGAVTLDRRPMQPTPFGAQLCRHLEQVALLEQAFFAEHETLFDVDPAPTVPLRIGVEDDAMASWLTDMVARVKPCRPAVLLDIELLTSVESAAARTQHRLCGGLTVSERVAAGFECHVIGAHTLHAVAAPRFVKRHFSDGVCAERLSQVPRLEYARDDPCLAEWCAGNFGASLTSNAHVLPSAHGIANACADGVGWAVCSSTIIADRLAAGDLVEIVPNSAMRQSLYWHVSDHVSAALLPITDALKSALKGSAIGARQVCASLTTV